MGQYSETGSDVQLLLPQIVTGDSGLRFRPIHYLGSKLRLLDPILAVIDEIQLETRGVCDLFAGSGTVSLALSRSYSVTAVDIQEYSRVLCSALLFPNDRVQQSEEDILRSAVHESRDLEWAFEPLLDYEDAAFLLAQRGKPQQLCDIVENGSILASRLACPPASTSLTPLLDTVWQRLREVNLETARSSLMSCYFGGVYFSYRQTLELDALLEAIAAQPPQYHDTLLAAALTVASEAVNTVGKQFAQPLKPRDRNGSVKSHLIVKMLRDRAYGILANYPAWLRVYSDIPKGLDGHSVIRGDYRQVLPRLHKDVGVIYADPPYTRDHYSRFYHLLETMCLRDNPGFSTCKVEGHTVASRGLYRPDRHQSPFCVKSKAEKAFTELFVLVSKLQLPLVLSYSPYNRQSGLHPRMMALSEICALAAKNFHSIEVRSIGNISHSKLNRIGLHLETPVEAEVLLICRP
jgi:16S rRNA G966 N2-methylase RsmD